MSDINTQDPAPSPLGRGVRTLVGVIVGFFVLILGITFIVESLPMSGENNVGLVRIEGVILDPREAIRQIKRFEDDPTISAIVVRVDSPGGAVVPSQEIYAALMRIRENGQNTIVTSMGNMAASGGYYIASASNTIIANPGTITGSIGVIMEMTNVEELLENVGVKSVVIKSGLHKDLASPFRPMDKASRQILQSVMDDVHDQFIHAVAEGRAMEVDHVQSLADGRIFTGRQAVAEDLVDRLGTLQDAIQLAADLAGISEEPTVIEIEPRFSFQDFIRGEFTKKLESMIRPYLWRLKFQVVL